MTIPAERREVLYAALFESLKHGASLAAACRAAGISRSAVYADMKKDPAIRARVMEIEKACIAIVEDALFVKAASGNLGAICFYLGNMAPEKWRDIRKVQIEAKTEIAVDLAKLLQAVPPLETTAQQLPDGPVPAVGTPQLAQGERAGSQGPIMSATGAEPASGSAGGPTTKYAVGAQVTAVGAEALGGTHGAGKVLTVRAVHIDGDDVEYAVASGGEAVWIRERGLAAVEVEEIPPGEVVV